MIGDQYHWVCCSCGLEQTTPEDGDAIDCEDCRVHSGLICSSPSCTYMVDLTYDYEIELNQAKKVEP